MPKCPEHKSELFYRWTKYGPRGECPMVGCTVVHWAEDKTATPADVGTRQARREAHGVFDLLWVRGKYKRNRLYQKLANHLHLPKKKTHIGQFDIEQCRKVIEFVKGLENG